MENKKLKEYLDEFKDDAALHVIVANPQDRKIRCYVLKLGNLRIWMQNW